MIGITKGTVDAKLASDKTVYIWAHEMSGFGVMYTVPETLNQTGTCNGGWTLIYYAEQVIFWHMALEAEAVKQTGLTHTALARHI